MKLMTLCFFLTACSVMTGYAETAKLKKVGLHGPDGKTQVLQANALGQFVFQTQRATNYELKPL